MNHLLHNTIKLAYGNSHLRPFLLPLIKIAVDVKEVEGSSDPKALDEFSNSKSPDIRRAVACNRNTSPETLRKLSTDTRTDVQESVALNRNTPLDALRYLAENGEISALGAVAMNPSITPELSSYLSNNDYAVGSLVMNPKIPVDLLRRVLEHNKDKNVMCNAASNPILPKDIMVEFSKSPIAAVRRYLAMNRMTSPEILALLSDDTDEEIRSNVALNRSTPVDVLKKLLKDSDGGVAETASRTLYKVDPSLKEFKGDPRVFHKLLNPEQIEKLIKGHSSLPEKASYSWGEVSKALNVPSLSKEVQSILISLKDKSGRVDTGKLKETVTKLVGGEHVYDIQLDAYSGLQTIHPKKKTTVIQLNISGEFESKLKSSHNYEAMKEYINWLTGDTSGHPVEPGKTVAWARVTDFPENETLIIEELQSDTFSERNMENFRSKTHTSSPGLEDIKFIMGEWEYCALQAVKRFAEHKGYKTLYMVPGSIKAKGNKRSKGYESGSDSALKRIYDTIPAKVGFKMVNKSDLPDWLKSNENIETGLWVIETHQMKVGKMDEKSLRSAAIRLASAKPELRVHLLPLLKKTSSEDRDIDDAKSSSSPFRLDELANSKSPEVHKHLAENPHASSDVLRKLSFNSKDPDVLKLISKHKNAPAHMREHLPAHSR